MKIFVITQNEPFYIPKMIRYMLAHRGDDVEFVGYTVLKPHRKNKNMYHWFMERMQVYSILEIIYVFTAMFFVKLIGLFSSRFSVAKNFNEAGIRSIESSDINTKEYLDQLRSIEGGIDIIISISSPQLFGDELLQFPRVACINAHGTLLPRHRGVFGSWWTLFCNDEVGGATIHTMELKLDAGEILWQEEFPIEKDETQYSIAYKTKKMMARGLLEVVRNFDSLIKSPVQPTHETSYHRAPTKEQGKEFHRAGNTIISASNLGLMLSGKY